MTEDEIKLFHNQDDEYNQWVGSHGGYVLTPKTRGGGFSLHAADCYHLGPYRKPGAMTTRKPRRWAASAHSLRKWVREEGGGEEPWECLACMGTASSSRRSSR